MRKQSMAGLFMSFKINREPVEKKKKPPKLPPRGDISEDSMEDMVSDIEMGTDLMPGQHSQQPPMQMIATNGKGLAAQHSKNLSIDTDTILKNANISIDSSMVVDTQPALGKNALPLPKPLPESIQITEAYLKQFK